MSDNNGNKPRGMFDEVPKEQEQKHYHGMFEEDYSSHHMSKKKEKTIAICVVVAFVLFAVIFFLLRVRWQREIWHRYVAAPRTPSYSVCVPGAPAPENLLF